MPIFVAASATRKILFRIFVVSVIAILLASSFLFIFHFIFFAPTRPPVTYQDVQDYFFYYHSAANDKKIALTFDDGPTVPYTRTIMDALEKHQVPGTFFFMGSNVLANPEIVKEASDRGFGIGNHSFTHSPQVHSSRVRLALELHTTGFLIERITGVEPTYYRPPFLLTIGIDGVPNPHIETLEPNTWSMEQSYLPVGIDIDTKDWQAKSTDDVIHGLQNNVESGHIVLLHDNEYTAADIDEIITWLTGNGYQLVTLDELLVPPSHITLATTLRRGMTNAQTAGDVSKLQWFLYKQGELSPYALTGVFDEQTEAALLSFQIRNKLVSPEDLDLARAGIADAATRNLIGSISAQMPALPLAHASTPTQETPITAIERGFIYFLAHGTNAFAVLVFLGLVFGLARVALLLGIFAFVKREKAVVWDEARATEEGLSVLIPAWNEAENIRSSLESLIHSTHKKKELIVIDDGSTDATPLIVQAVIKEYPDEAIQLISVENGGKARALNIGCAAASYDLIAVLDADAALDPGALTAMVRHFADSAVGAVAGKVYTTGQKSLIDRFQAIEYMVGQNIDKEAFSRIGAVGVVPGPAGTWRRQAVMDAGGFDTSTLAEDQDMTLSILKLGYKIRYEPTARAYTETPHTLKNFLKQRFRWIYGTIQCFWKHKRAMIDQPHRPIGFMVLPHNLIFSIALPILYPIMDTALVVGLLLPGAKGLLIPFLLFTAFDIAYATFGLRGERGAWKLLVFVPLQRVFYRQLLYYTVIKGVVCAIEGTGTKWNKFAKVGDTQRFFLNTINPQTQQQTSNI